MGLQEIWVQSMEKGRGSQGSKGSKGRNKVKQKSNGLRFLALNEKMGIGIVDEALVYNVEDCLCIEKEDPSSMRKVNELI